MFYESNINATPITNSLNTVTTYTSTAADCNKKKMQCMSDETVGNHLRSCAFLVTVVSISMVSRGYLIGASIDSKGSWCIELFTTKNRIPELLYILWLNGKH